MHFLSLCVSLSLISSIYLPIAYLSDKVQQHGDHHAGEMPWGKTKIKVSEKSDSRVGGKKPLRWLGASHRQTAVMGRPGQQPHGWAKCHIRMGSDNNNKWLLLPEASVLGWFFLCRYSEEGFQKLHLYMKRWKEKVSWEKILFGEKKILCVVSFPYIEYGYQVALSGSRNDRALCGLEKAAPLNSAWDSKLEKRWVHLYKEVLRKKRVRPLNFCFWASILLEVFF